MAWTLIASPFIALPAAAAYVYGGWLLARRARSRSAPALGLFALFWLGLGAYGFVEGAWVLSHLAGVHGLGLAVALLHLRVISSVVGFFGLVAYIGVLLTGRRAVVVAVAALYAALLAAVESFYIWKGPMGVREGVWGLRIEYAHPDPGALWTVVVLLLFVPPLLAALAYASLLRVVREPAQRFRVGVISVSFLAFFGAMTAGWVVGDWYWWGLVEKLLGAATGAAVLVALRPPAWVRRHLDMRVLEAPPDAAPGALEAWARRAAASVPGVLGATSAAAAGAPKAADEASGGGSALEERLRELV